MKKPLGTLLMALAFAGCFGVFAFADAAGAVLTVFIGLQALLVVLAIVVIAAAVIIIRSGKKMRPGEERPGPERRKKR